MEGRVTTRTTRESPPVSSMDLFQSLIRRCDNNVTLELGTLHWGPGEVQEENG